MLIIFSIIWAMLIFRLYKISIQSNYLYEKLAKEKAKKKYFIKPIRGEILDKNMELLAMNKIGFSIKIAPHLNTNKNIFKELIQDIKKEFPDINLTKITINYKKKNSKYNHKYIKIIDFLSHKKIMNSYAKLFINTLIKIEPETKRYYPYANLSAHIIGYVGKSNKKENAKDNIVKNIEVVGKTGLEKEYNNILQGKLGFKIVQVNALNKEIFTLQKKLPLQNQNIKLNIDIKLQKFINSLFKDKSGVVVVMNVNGKVLSAISYPSYDPNLFIGGISTEKWKILRNDPRNPFSNKIVNGLYPPGSTIKMGIALATSINHKSILDKKEVCRGYITIGSKNRKFRCWSRWGHGSVDLRKAIRESCDVFFYQKSLKIGVNNISKYLNLFGLGVKTEIDLPREFLGIIPNKKWKKKKYNKAWYLGDTLNTSIGQGYAQVTPIQIARYTAFIATGKLPTPYIVYESAGKITKPKYKDISIDKEYIKKIRLGMYDVCNSNKGTAKSTMSKLPIIVAGKTGTSQVVGIPQNIKKRLNEKDMEVFKRSHAWITTYAPYNNPKYIVTILVEHGGHGGSTSGAIAAEIYKWLHKNKYLD